jgi:hypothetical protein
MSSGVVEVLVRAMGGGELLRVLVEPGVYLVGSSVEAGLRVIAFEDGFVTEPKPAMIQRICACRVTVQALPEALAL